ncbi:NAD(P)-binding protein [Nemania abortiva]|nr:NAD(P)-binding protein [Nemania abortiva]
MLSGNKFPVLHKTVVLTGGSRGMGLAVGRQLAEKGANIVIVAREKQRLVEGLKHIQEGALHPETQRFHHISADLALATEAIRVIDEVVTWNSGPPDIVWCCAGSPQPTLFIDTPVSQLDAQMSSNYFTSAYMAHAILTCWLRTSRAKDALPYSIGDKPSTARSQQLTPRHLIFTSSLAAFFSLAGYAPYTPGKIALRGLSDTLSQEMNLYAAAHPDEPPVRVHTIFPSTILGEAFDAENKIKFDVTRMLEASANESTPETIAYRSIRGLESGEELITTDFSGSLLRRTLTGATRRGIWTIFVDCILASILTVVVAFVRADMDRQVRQFARKFGDSGMKMGRPR